MSSNTIATTSCENDIWNKPINSKQQQQQINNRVRPGEFKLQSINWTWDIECTSIGLLLNGDIIDI